MKHIDNLFKEKLYNHKASVPEGMWEKIAPIAEEESGRAVLWFWFASALALLLGGYGIYKMINSETPNDPGTLAFEEQIKAQSPEFSAVDILTTDTYSQSTIVSEKSSVIHEPAIMDVNNSIPTDNNSKGANAEKETSKKEKVTAKSTPIIKSSIVNNTVERISSTIGVPANLVITKSYINKEGSIIKQSHLTESTESRPVYDVIINSEEKDLNAGTLLRIIEPVESIPLPSLHKTLKKKITVPSS